MKTRAEPFRAIADVRKAPAWMAGIIWKKGKEDVKGQVSDVYFPQSCAANAATILAADPRWQGVIAYDSFAEQTTTRKVPPWHPDDAPDVEPGIWREEDTTRAAMWLQRAYRITLSTGTVHELVAMVARRAPYHPVRDWLRSLRWDGQMRLPSFFADFFGVADTAYSRWGGPAFMVSAVARIMDPGCKVDTVPILEGMQGIGKSSALRALVPDEWFLEFAGGVDGKDAFQQLRRKWIVELPELDALSKAEASRAKAFFSAQVDTYRASYGRTTNDYPRQCVCVGTTNKNRYFSDETGNRRYLPMACSKADRKGVEAARDQLWAEALARYESSEKWHVEDPELLDACRVEQESRYVADVWESIVAEWLSRPSELGNRASLGITTGDVLQHALKLESGRMGRPEEMRVALVLRRLGWEAGKQETRNGARVRLYRPAQASGVTVGGWDQGWADLEVEQLHTDNHPAQPTQPDLTCIEGHGE